MYVDRRAPRAPWGRFDDLVGGGAMLFGPCQQQLVAATPSEVLPLLDDVQVATEDGWWAFGFVTYEAAAGLDDSLAVSRATAKSGEQRLPLAWFGLCESPTGLTRRVGCGARSYRAGPWALAWSRATYREAVDRVREAIAAGDTYQCNLTTTFHTQLTGEIEQFYDDLIHAQGCRYGAYLDLGRHVIASASPELFFEWQGQQILTRPMKGTAPRGRTGHEDAQRVSALLESAKERAENIIVVDLLRNDLSKIAITGGVSVPVLLRPERYETVWQLTSDVVATVRPDVRLADVFRALFPCGSVTGAPKPATMRLIRDLEARARGVYCGAIGVVAPPGAPYRARFSVGIRTAVVDRRSGRCEYGVGSGITWHSDPDAEYAEIRAKAAILWNRPQDFELLETMLYLPEAGVRNLERHLRRLTDSAEYFGFPLDTAAVRASVLAAVAEAERSTIRLLLSRDGDLHVEVLDPPDAPPGLVTLELDRDPVDATQPWLFHKTTRRELYKDKASRHPGADDVVLINDRGHITETTIANIAVRRNGRWLTPPTTDGCLPGVERARLIDAGVLVEQSLSPADISTAASEIILISSLRGWRRARLQPASRHNKHPREPT